MRMNLASATMETDFSNPMVFDSKGIKTSYREKANNMFGEDTPFDKWKCVYTTYFNSTLTIKEGRRVDKEKCLENPNVNLLRMACTLLKLRCIVEPIAKHPRDYFNSGRLKVELIDENGDPKNADIGTSKRKLFAMMAEKFPEAQTQYDELLAEQKAGAEANKKEL